jgi:hypothetical protein
VSQPVQPSFVSQQRVEEEEEVVVEEEEEEGLEAESVG